jgi:hypothetical protein
MKEITFNSSERQNQLVLNLPPSLEKGAAEGVEKWIAPALKKVRAIASAPEYAKVATVERRRAEAAEKIEERTAKIREVRQGCASHVLDETGAMETAHREIEECERAIAAARLTVESCEAALPALREARQQVTRDRLNIALEGLRDKLGEEEQRVEDQIRQGVYAGYKRLLNIESRRQRVSSLQQREPADILALLE